MVGRFLMWINHIVVLSVLLGISLYAHSYDETYDCAHWDNESLLCTHVMYEDNQPNIPVLYIGEWGNGKANGFGVARYYDENTGTHIATYSGFFKNGERNGYGILAMNGGKDNFQMVVGKFERHNITGEVWVFKDDKNGISENMIKINQAPILINDKLSFNFLDKHIIKTYDVVTYNINDSEQKYGSCKKDGLCKIETNGHMQLLFRDSESLNSGYSFIFLSDGNVGSGYMNKNNNLSGPWYHIDADGKKYRTLWDGNGKAIVVNKLEIMERKNNALYDIFLNRYAILQKN